MKLVLALLLVGCVAGARPAVVVVEGMRGGLILWDRSDQAGLFRGTQGRDEVPPATRQALVRIEQQIDRIQQRFRKGAPSFRRTDALTRALWLEGDALAQVAASLDPSGVAAAGVYRLVGKAFALLDDDEAQLEAHERRNDSDLVFGAFDAPEWGAMANAALARCVEVASARLDLDDVDRCDAARSVGFEIFATDVAWQPALVAAP